MVLMSREKQLECTFCGAACENVVHVLRECLVKVVVELVLW